VCFGSVTVSVSSASSHAKPDMGVPDLETVAGWPTSTGLLTPSSCRQSHPHLPPGCARLELSVRIREPLSEAGAVSACGTPRGQVVPPPKRLCVSTNELSIAAPRDASVGRAKQPEAQDGVPETSSKEDAMATPSKDEIIALEKIIGRR
jgi:hypothetical protein